MTNHAEARFHGAWLPVLGDPDVYEEPKGPRGWEFAGPESVEGIMSARVRGRPGTLSPERVNFRCARNHVPTGWGRGPEDEPARGDAGGVPVTAEVLLAGLAVLGVARIPAVASLGTGRRTRPR